MIEIDDKLLKNSINEIAGTEAGKVFFAALMDTCRWDATYVSSEDPQVTQFFAAQRGVYGAIRKLIRTEYLRDIEFNYKRKPHDNGKRTDKRSNGLTNSRSKRTGDK